MKTWQDILFDILSLFSKTERPTKEELRAYKEEAAQRLPQPPPTRIQIILDPRIRHTASYDAPSPTTDGKIMAQGIRHQAMADRFQRQTGQLRDWHGTMLKQKEISRDAPPTHILEKAPKSFEHLINGDTKPKAS